MTGKYSKPSVAIVQRIVPYYRVPFFNLLANINSDLEINIYHGSQTIGGGILPAFRSHYHKNYEVNLFGYSLVFQPRLMLDVLLTRPDVVVLEGTFGIITNFVLLLIRRVTGKHTIYWTAGWDNPKISGWRVRLKSLLVKLCVHLSDGAIAYGGSALEYLSRHGLPREKIIVAQNTIDVETILTNHDYWLDQGRRIRRKYASHVEYVVVCVGQLTPIKRVDVLLKAFSCLRSKRNDIALLIVGDGGQRNELSQLAKENQIPDVHFIGEVIGGVEAYFSASDLFVLPGTGGLALNQAMALGLPVVATVADGTELDLIVSGKNGYIVPIDDVNAMAFAIEKILDSSRLRKRMSANSLKIIQERATLHNMVEKYSMAIHKRLHTNGS